MLSDERLHIDWNVVQWLKMDGTEYQTGFVVLNSLINETPIFGQVRVIAVDENGPFFVLKLFDVLAFDAHFHAFEVQEKETWLCVKDFLTHIPTNVRVISNGKNTWRSIFVLKT